MLPAITTSSATCIYPVNGDAVRPLYPIVEGRKRISFKYDPIYNALLFCFNLFRSHFSLRIMSHHSKDEKLGGTDELQATSKTADAEIGNSIDFIDPAKELRLLVKLDTALVPIIMLTYLTCFLDRSSIGNVKVAGMPEDIGASSEQFSIAISIFYGTYVAFETPWSILLKKLTPRFLLTGLSVVWSLTTIFSGFISSPGGLYAARLILGACEGGLFPSLNLYLTMIYRREEIAKRVSYLFVCTAISGAFGGLLAYALLQMDGVGGLAGWKYAVCNMRIPFL